VDTLILSTALGAVAELGDKSQFVLLILAFRFREESAAVISGMTGAMAVANLPAGAAGAWFGSSITPFGVHLFIALLLFAMAARALTDLGQTFHVISSRSVFATVFLTVLLGEMGDKSQMASALASANGSPIALTGSILGSIMINLPVAISGPILAERLASRQISRPLIARFGAVLFSGMGVISASALNGHALGFFSRWLAPRVTALLFAL
jgi:Ca2+/H+ antiporter, TMEM165/GDT1 family